jgi:hypothetical protein
MAVRVRIAVRYASGVVTPLRHSVARHWVLRVVLLAAITVGVAAMHALGHHDAEPAAGGAHHHLLAQAVVSPPAQQCHDLCRDPLQACLFTLAAAGLLTLTALAASTTRTQANDAAGDAATWPWCAGVRAPPRLFPFGLRVALLSVWRI